MFVCLARKTLDYFLFVYIIVFTLVSLKYLANSLHTKQRGLTIWFTIPQKNLCSCVQKIQNKHNGGAGVAFFVSASITHSLTVERLSAFTALLGNKDKSPENAEA